MKTYGIRDNKNSSVPWNNSLEEQLYNTAISGNANVLKAAPTSDQINVTGDNKFVYDATTKLWKTGTLTLTAPVQHDFTLSLPAGITTETGSTVIKTGESFVLMTNVKPAADSTASISADLSWIDGGLRRYTPAGKAVASDGKGFQDMIGVLIKSTTVASSFSLTYEEPKKSDEKPSQTRSRATNQRTIQRENRTINLRRNLNKSRKIIPEVTTKTQINLMRRKMAQTLLPLRRPRPKTPIPAHRIIRQITIIPSQPTLLPITRQSPPIRL